MATDEFYNSYAEDPVLNSRIEFLEDSIGNKDDLRALGIFSFGEGAILYTTFGFLKHFQSKGKNKALNIVSGINFSARDEDLHSQAAGWLFKTLLKEKKEAGLITEAYERQLQEDIYKAAEIVLEHEKAIIAKLFEKGPIEGITETQLEHFAEHRINKVLGYLGYNNLYQVKYNPIGDWFYKGVDGYGMIDFFSSQGNMYVRGWSGEGFTF